ncbi:putative metalloprotease CJM1_0395 family protein [Aliiglaciecola sp. 3_MG-2023]|uniref:putative metalloprotease CJM1_0395 family protein n=1 Tax=Aliiglaciecola sp. 3_MG-2023 TaxID=3062644 RepID=UPI0026E2DCDD|nr:putative metalloprotease CJM1_0395 family protein [Aliiglaciecola sp. 3_MG-2023]MDO6694370.1 putative metalloprotease CJM1_0395 family protein [Aliiglaciecola sp. 3_MG-2023]
MNIVTPTPTAILFPTNNVSTDAARRDNQQRETIPQTSNAENSAAESGLGSESDRVKTPSQQVQVTYERPQAQQNSQTQSGATQENLADKDNAEDPSAGKEDAESKQQQQQLADQQEIEELKERDAEVRSHEQAHAAVGGQYAASPTYEYENGPDGNQYAVSGEVSIDISEEETPEETIRKMQQVRAAALAPADPSSQDLRVASEATKIATEARSDIAKEKAESAKQAITNNIEQQFSDSYSSSVEESTESPLTANVPDLDEIVDGFAAEPPTRSLDRGADIASLEQNRERLENRDGGILQRVSVIENFYQKVSEPRSSQLQLSA